MSFVATRLLAAIVVGGLAVLVGASWYAAGALAGLAAVGLLVASRQGRHLSTANGAVLRRDERGRMIADRAARNGFVVLLLAVAAITVAAHALGRTSVSVGLVDAALAAGALAWLASDLWQRRG
ncbi:MAG TPA: hypothetical protein VKB31_07420 [Trueperaceae bacterium]|nr:hypothetical protein [Trueperaceae bacterium]